MLIVSEPFAGSVPMLDTTATNRKPVAFALQGGGAHGAFVWGVLDQVLEDGRLSVEAISATSAGAMNAAAFASGLATGGPEGARAAMHDLWAAVAAMERQYAAAWWWLDALPRALGVAEEYLPSHTLLHALTHALPPDVLNPLRVNPLRGMLTDLIDVARLNAPDAPVKLFLSATNVRTGKIAIFTTPHVTVETVLASACLPPFFQAVEIDGEAYWDGGYLGNPAIYPLIYRKGARDVVVVQVSPIARPDLPRNAPDVVHRAAEIAFNSSLMREMRAIAFVTKLIDEHDLDQRKFDRIRMHWIGDDRLMASLAPATQFRPRWDFLCRLRDEGRRTARAWLDDNADAVGDHATLDLAAMFL